MRMKVSSPLLLALLCLAGFCIADSSSDGPRSGGPFIVGGNSGISTQDAEALLSRTLSKIAQGEGAPDIKIKRINSAQQQVVAGMLYKINGDFIINGEEKVGCDVKVWERAWLDNKEGGKGGQTDISCPGDGPKQFKHHVAKRSIGTPLPAAPNNFSNEEALELANKVFQSVDSGETSTQVTKVLSATKQLVAGIKYTLRVNINQSGQTKEDCEMIVYTRPWQKGDNTETTLSCPGEKKVMHKHKIVKRSLGGAEEFSHTEARKDLEDAFFSAAADQQPSYK